MKISDLLRQRLYFFDHVLCHMVTLCRTSVQHTLISYHVITTYIQKWVVQTNNSLCYFLCESKCTCAVISLTSSQSHWATQAEEVDLAVRFAHGAFVLSAEPIDLQPNTFPIKIPNWSKYCEGSRGGTVGWGTALPVGRLRVRFPVVSLEFFIDIILPATLWPWGWLSL